jgi:hypothetical protein
MVFRHLDSVLFGLWPIVRHVTLRPYFSGDGDAVQSSTSYDKSASHLPRTLTSLYPAHPQ